MQSVYIETTIPSFIAARNSKNIIIFGQQEATRLFWEKHRQNYSLFISPAVFEECAKGDAALSAKRLELISEMKSLERTHEVYQLSQTYLHLLGIPEKSKLDATHLAYTVINKLDILLTWNCVHLASPFVADKLRNYNTKNNLWEPFLFTPNELIGGNSYVQE